jgi:ribosomal protein S12 methylthiotransferase accessory factor
MRAITEAAQTRITFIHGAREDIRLGSYTASESNSRLFAFFNDLAPRTSWQSFEEVAEPNLFLDYCLVLEHLAAAGYNDIFRVVLTQSALNIPVVKVLVPGLQFNRNLF